MRHNIDRQTNTPNCSFVCLIFRTETKSNKGKETKQGKAKNEKARKKKAKRKGKKNKKEEKNVYTKASVCWVFDGFIHGGKCVIGL